MSPEVLELVGYQRAEFAKAGQVRMWMIVTQIMVALPAIGSVFVEAGPCVLLLALAGLAMVLTWLALERRYSRLRQACGRARRASLIMGGLGQSISAVELLSIKETLSATEDQAKRFVDPNYFASQAPPGRRRLGEMLQESAFWTSRMQGESARLMWGAFLLSVIAVGLLFTVVVAFAVQNVEERGARVMLAILTLLISTDILGSAMAHSEAASGTERIVHRLADAEARNYPEPDILLILSDYNAIVETTPIAVPGLYELHRNRLERLFQAFQSTRSRSTTT